MNIFKKISISHWDILQFSILSTIFSVSFFAYNHAYSPVVETTYDSASIFSREQKAMQLISEKQAEEINQNIQPEIISEKNGTSSGFILSFRPENITIDDSLLQEIRTNVESKIFAPKIDPLHLLLDSTRKDPRGQVSGNTLILSTKIPTDTETLKVLVHELGHIVDIFYLPKHADGSDLSDEFYDISWLDYNIKKKEAKIADFVSGYALSNKYEDFAESFAFYVFHNDEFSHRAQSDDSLQKKYDFFRNQVFTSNDFFSTSFSIGRLPTYNWDVTKIPVNIKKYLYYIQ